MVQGVLRLGMLGALWGGWALGVSWFLVGVLFGGFCFQRRLVLSSGCALCCALGGLSVVGGFGVIERPKIYAFARSQAKDQSRFCAKAPQPLTLPST